MTGLPPKWYSRLENWLILNKWLLLAMAIFALFFVVPLFSKPEHLDEQLLNGIDK